MSIKKKISPAMKNAETQFKLFLWFMIPLVVLVVGAWIHLLKQAHSVADGPTFPINDQTKDYVLKRVDLISAELQVYLVLIGGVMAAAMAKVFRDPVGHRRSWLHVVAVLILGFGFLTGFFTWMTAQSVLHDELQRAIVGTGAVFHSDQIQMFRNWMQGELTQTVLFAIFILAVPVVPRVEEEAEVVLEPAHDSV